MRKKLLILTVLLLAVLPLRAEDGAFMKFFYKVGVWMDNYAMKDIDSSYITLPEHSWRVALTNSEIGIHSAFDAKYNEYDFPRFRLQSVTTPSLDLGFHIGLRSIGFGYSWDALHAYAQKLNFSLGGKSWGVELSRQKSTNIHSTFLLPETKDYTPVDLGEGNVFMSNTNLKAWYALNSAHYSHNAAVKQAYIQRRTAGSLMLSLSYMNTDISIRDSAFDGLLVALMNDVHEIVTHQVAAGVGYGINYTPNKGKVLLHASAMAQVVFYSVNYISYSAPDSLKGLASPSYTIRPSTPVHLTGTMRMAVSWEINKWVHLSARAQVDNVRFRTEASTGMVELTNWNWQANLALGVRLGMGRARVQHALGIEPKSAELEPKEEKEATLYKLPQWITGYFFSPTH